MAATFADTLPQILPKPVATACAQALLAGIQVALSHDDKGMRTLILSRGAWTRETTVDRVADAIAEAKAVAA
ncbi:MAG: hypothetical protein AB7I35_12850 [Ramlibacter sp.]